MKAVKLILCLLAITFFSTNSYSRIINIWHPNTVFLWLPDTVQANVGDTIKWLGSEFEVHHATFCDGFSGTILPPGAVPWLSPILTLKGFYYTLAIPGIYVYMCPWHLNKGTIIVSIPTGINPDVESIYSFNLYQNYPNPFNPVTKIKFDIPSIVNHESSIVKLAVYNSAGEEVQTLINENLNSGSYEVEFNGAGLSSGVYYYKLITAAYSNTKKLILLK